MIDIINGYKRKITKYKKSKNAQMHTQFSYVAILMAREGMIIYALVILQARTINSGVERNSTYPILRHSDPLYIEHEIRTRIFHTQSIPLNVVPQVVLLQDQ